MHKVDYCQKRLIRNVLLAAVAGLILLVALPSGGVMWAAGGMALGAAALMATKAFGDRSAVLWDQRGITLVTLTGKTSVDWREVRDIGCQRITQYALGIIPVNRWDYLTIKTRGGLLVSKRHRINAGLLELPPGGSAELARLLGAAHAAALAGTAVPGAPAAPRVVAEAEDAPDGGFDPDAAIARYLARKAAEPQAMAEAAADAPAGLTAPPRPVFGRKAV